MKYIPIGEAHHILAQKFRNTFLKKGLNIDDPRFGTWVNTDAHRKWSYQYNKEWEKYLSRNRNASSKQILSFARQLAKKYKFSTHF